MVPIQVPPALARHLVGDRGPCRAHQRRITVVSQEQRPEGPVAHAATEAFLSTNLIQSANSF